MTLQQNLWTRSGKAKLSNRFSVPRLLSGFLSAHASLLVSALPLYFLSQCFYLDLLTGPTSKCQSLIVIRRDDTRVRENNRGKLSIMARNSLLQERISCHWLIKQRRNNCLSGKEVNYCYLTPHKHTKVNDWNN